MKRVLPRHKITYAILRFLSFIYTRWILGFRCKDRYKIKKGESIIVLSNHQTDSDPLCIFPSFKGRLYPVATDTIYYGKFKGKLFNWWSAAITKKKGAVDKECILSMLKTVKEGGSLILFPEGNRTYAEFQFYITPNFAKLIRRLSCTIVLYNINGGTGVRPRFSKARRRGKFYGKIRRVIKKDEYDKMTDDELFKVIKESLKVFDSDSGLLYKSKTRAEYLERMFFVCPKCESVASLNSHGSTLSCEKCDFTLEYNENLTISTSDTNIKFSKLLDYWNWQKRFVKKIDVTCNDIIFSDKVKLLKCEKFKNNIKLYEGLASLCSNSFIFGDIKFNIKDIEIASVVSGTKLTMTITGVDYLVLGDERFNPLKYVLLFNKLDTYMKLNRVDDYFTLEEN